MWPSLVALETINLRYFVSETLFTSEVLCLQSGKYIAGCETQEPSKVKY